MKMAYILDGNVIYVRDLYVGDDYIIEDGDIININDIDYEVVYVVSIAIEGYIYVIIKNI